jgi:hypothetical protein
MGKLCIFDDITVYYLMLNNIFIIALGHYFKMYG